MVNWVSVLRRVMRLYNVTTQQELGMALGVPFHIGMDETQDLVIPWPVLEMIVAEKNLSWDWLLTGKYYRENRSGDQASDGRDDPPPRGRDEGSGQEQADDAAAKPPRIETRELARRLLPADGDEETDRDWDPAPALAPPPMVPPESRGDSGIARELRRIKDAMQTEMERVDQLIREQERLRGGGSTPG